MQKDFFNDLPTLFFSDRYRTVEEHRRSQWLPGPGKDDGNMQKSHLMGTLREKEGQHPVLEVYYFHIS